MDICQMLRELTDGAGVSGREDAVISTAGKYLEKYGKTHTDALGNLICEIDGEGSSILVDAHIDRVGIIVTSITDEGFLRVDACGSIDNRTLCAAQVTVHGKTDIKGVVISTPPHLQKGNDESAAMSTNEALIDTGLTASQVKSTVTLGDRVTVDSDFITLLNNRVACHALDDRAGMAAIICALDILKSRGCKRKITVSFSTREEVGCIGGKTAAFNAEADELIAVDVSFAYTPDSSREECGELSKGPMIGVSSSLDYEMSQALTSVAKKCEIPYQLEIMGGRTGTNADTMTISSKGMKSGLVSIPLRYMHTGIEVVSISDVENTGKLIAEYILSGGACNA